MFGKTGRHWQRPEQTHPMWCDVARCLSPYNHLGEHRSTPLVKRVPGHGTVTAILTQRPGGHVWLEIILSARVPAVDPAKQRAWAGRLLAGLGQAIARAVDHRPTTR